MESGYHNSERSYILLVEDDDDDIELARLALKRGNIKTDVVVKSDGRKALEFLDELPADDSSETPKPAVILLDINMPEIDGFEVLKRIKRKRSTKNIPVIMLSSSEEEQDVARSYEYGANSYVSKPLNFDEYEDTVKKVGRYWLELNKTATF